MRKLFSYIICIVIILTNTTTAVFSKEPAINIIESYLTDQELIVNLKLENGLDFDRFHTIRKGIHVKLIFIIKVVQKNVFWPDTVLSIKNQKKQIDKLVVTKELSYDYITKNYVIKTIRNYSDDVTVDKYYSGDTVRERFVALKQYFFDSKVSLYLDLDRIPYDQKQEYYVKIKSSFLAVKTYPTFIPNSYNFETAEISHNIVKQ
ncbi:MAG: hypothetical protein OEZ36_14415 [Spirochaetota bacterium]|nr:hypothetical protein [Spirochaetota bacterium]